MEKCKIERVYIRFEECTIKDCNWKVQDWKGELLEVCEILVVLDWKAVRLEECMIGGVKHWKSERLKDCMIGSV